jgi:hypothetical protein
MFGRQPWVSAQKGHNFWSDRLIALNFLQGFREGDFFWVVMEWLLGDEDVWSVKQEYWLKRAITFGPTVGSHSKFYRGFQRLFRWVSSGIAVEWRGCLVANLEYRLKRAIKVYPTIGSRLNFYRGFQGLFSVGYVWSTEKEHWLKRAITFGPTVGLRSNFCMGFQRLFSLGKLWNR